MSVGRAALLIAALTAASRALGFVREAVYAAVFGASAELDAFLVAQGLPNIAVTLIASAVVTSAIPVLSGQLARGEDEAARRTFHTLFTAVLLALIVLALGLAVAARPLIELTAPGFDRDGVDLAVRLTRVLLAGSAFVAAMNLIAGLLQAHRQFFWPALVGIPFNLVMILAAALFGGEHGAIALAVGFVVASAVRVGFEAPGLRRIRFRPRAALDLRDPGLRLVLGMAPLVLLGNSVANVNTFVDRLVGSLAGEGAISALNYGFRLVALPHGLLALALLQAIYPSLARADAAGDTARFRELTGRGLATLGLALLPFAAGCVALREPLVAVVYGRGEFSAADAALTSEALAFYAGTVVLLGWRELLVRAFYSLEDARTPVLTALVAMGVNVVGDVTLGRAFGVPGIAVSTTISLAVSFGLLLWVLRSRHALVDVGRFGSCAWRALVAASCAGLAMHLAHAALADTTGTGAAGQVLALAVPGLTGLGLYAFLVRLLAPAEAAELFGTVRRGLAGLRSRAS